MRIDLLSEINKFITDIFQYKHLQLQLFTKHTKIIKNSSKMPSLNGLVWGENN